MTRLPAPGTDCLPANPLRATDWRWRRAVQLLEPRARRRRQDDNWVVRSRRFRVDLARAGGDIRRPRLARVHPEILGAYIVRQGETFRRWEVEARLLAGQDDDDIASRVGIEPGVVAAYATIFFDVRTRLPCSDWIAAHVLGERLYEGFDASDTEAVWKIIAYQGGPLVFDALIESIYPGGQLANRELTEQFELLIKLMATPVTSGNSKEILKLEARLRALDRVATTRSVVVLNKPVLIAPIDIQIGPETVSLERATCALDGLQEARQTFEVESMELEEAG